PTNITFTPMLFRRTRILRASLIPTRGRATEFDRRQNFVAFYAYDPPAFKGRGLKRLLLNRWQVGALTQLRSGSPIDITGSGDNFRPDFVGPFERFGPRHDRTFVFNGTPVVGNFLFNPNAFKTPARPLGTLGRNVFDGPGFNPDITFDCKAEPDS